MRRAAIFVAMLIMGWVAVLFANMVFDGRADWVQVGALYALIAAGVTLVVNDV